MLTMLLSASGILQYVGGLLLFLLVALLILKNTSYSITLDGTTVV